MTANPYFADTAAGDYDLMTPEELWDLYRQGDRQALQTLIGQTAEPLFVFLHHYLGDYNTAADAYRDTWAQVAEQAEKHDPRERLRFWLYQTARKKALNMLDSRPAAETPAIAVAETIAEILSRNLPPAPDIEEFGRRLTKAVCALPLEQKDVFLLREDGDLTFLEISAIIGCSPESAQRYLGTALETLASAVRSDARLMALLSGL